VEHNQQSAVKITLQNLLAEQIVQNLVAQNNKNIIDYLN
jgi:hypothetical protein